MHFEIVIIESTYSKMSSRKGHREEESGESGVSVVDTINVFAAAMWHAQREELPSLMSMIHKSKMAAKACSLK